MAGPRPPGSLVKLTYDSRRELDVGDLLFTPTGRCYRIETARRQERGVRAGRWHLVCVVLDGHVADIPPGDDERRHPIEWYPRPRKRPAHR